MEKQLTPKESLEVILKAISNTKSNVRANSFYFLLWGWLIAVASFGFFVLMVVFDAWYHFILFPIVAVIGIAASIWYYSRMKMLSTESYLSDFLGKMWAVLGVSFFLVVFVTVSRGQAPFTYTLMLSGIGTLVSGWVMRFKPLMLGGVLFLMASIASIYIPQEYKALLQGVAVVVGYLIPGYLLKTAKG